MPNQTGIFAETQRSQYALEYAQSRSSTPDSRKEAIRKLRDVLNANDDVSSVLAFGADYYRTWAQERSPAILKPLAAISGKMPATHGDVWVWLQGPAPDVTLDAARAVDQALRPVFELRLDVPGFIYRDSRDLTGFVDGSANPKDDDRKTAALVALGEVGAGGAFVLSQKWIHDLSSFAKLSIADQERTIGRTKPDSIELEGDAMPADSHVSRTDVKVDGVAQKIWRRSFPYGTVSENGLYFVAFACDPARVDIQLRRMFGLADDGITDSLTGFSKPVSGAHWFAPSEDDLKALL